MNYLDLSENKRIKCFQLLYNAKKNKFIAFVEKHNVAINSITDHEFRTNFLMEVITGDSDYYGSKKQVEIVQYLLDNGIDVNHIAKEKYNAFEIALSHREMSKIALMLVQSKNSELHKTQGIAHKAIRAYSDAWREEDKEERKVLLEVVEELLKQNVDLEGCFAWLEIIKKDCPKLIELLEKYGHTLASIKKLDVVKEEEIIDTNIAIINLHNTINNKDYNKTAKVIWQKLVPNSGQAETVQGELLRAIEKLRDEAQRNGNCNFNKNCHGLLVKYLKHYLMDESIFRKETILEIKKDLKQLSYKTIPYTEDAIYDRITKRIVDWYLANPKQIAHIKNEKLCC